MADLQSKMDAHQHDIDLAKERIHDTTQKADSYLTELTKRVEEYEKSHSDFHPASEYLKSALDASRSATQKLKTQGQDLSERSVPVAIDGMDKVRESLDELKTQAVAYDDKYAGSGGQHAVDTLHHWVNTGRQSATDALETTSEQLTKLRDAIANMAGQATHGAQVAVGEAVRAAEFGDEKLGVSSKAGGVVQKVRALDERLGVSATAAKVDTKVTGGLGCRMAATTVEMVTESVSYISETLHNAKLAAQQSGTAQSMETKAAAATGAATAKKNEIQETFAEGYEYGKEKAGMAKEKAGEMKDMAAEKAGQTKEMAKEKTGEAQEKAGEMKDMTAEKVGQDTEMAKDKAGMVKGKAGEATEMSKEKAGDVKDKTAETAGQAKEMAKEKAGQAQDKAGDVKDKTAETASQAKEMAKEKAGQAQDKASDVKDKTAETAGQAKVAAQEKAGHVKDKAGDVKDKTQQKAGETKEQSKGAVGKAGDVKESKMVGGKQAGKSPK
ncbi:hypothetical protein PF005_g16456 [Phytophthora fragariae]|uniref:Uncharacterized protein n=1 Tax=Phytophthora fragariae TaxID=53985 RepID=A0A6A3EFQ0_9STRA|nr:hypothetical protein PF003_g31674 [Phytophthora fragariae]KAE8931373.1 hypothetical protein PF009_g18571 [Phytophthora fragariae]KAE8990218.1 hypothetical protein PF011_g18446 [Phytophthora fragariae]KAE9089244.1 hypothetical protein PF010_g19074 [Phytophthora fragariae]KAE9096961.1 hypothetical protein PF007_g16789 [Phytophthora fragariae]